MSDGFSIALQDCPVSTPVHENWKNHAQSPRANYCEKLRLSPDPLELTKRPVVAVVCARGRRSTCADDSLPKHYFFRPKGPFARGRGISVASPGDLKRRPGRRG